MIARSPANEASLFAGIRSVNARLRSPSKKRDRRNASPSVHFL